MSLTLFIGSVYQTLKLRTLHVGSHVEARVRVRMFDNCVQVIQLAQGVTCTNYWKVTQALHFGELCSQEMNSHLQKASFERSHTFAIHVLNLLHASHFQPICSLTYQTSGHL